MSHDNRLQKIPPVWIFTLITGFRNFLKRLYFSLVPANMAVFEKSQGFWLAKAIGVACELNLSEIIGKDEKTTEEIAGESNSDTTSVYRLLRALASEGIFRETRPGKFRNTKLSFALQEKTGNLKNMIMHQLNNTNWELINGLRSSVESGKEATEKLFAEGVFDHLKNTPEKNELYNKAMKESSELSGRSIRAAYSFKKFKTLVDIGGGNGGLLFAILKENPGLKGILFDFPHVVKGADEMASKLSVDDRTAILKGDFFTDELPAGDGYLLKNILHAFDDQKCIELLTSIRGVMKDVAKILVIEAYVNENNQPAFGKIFDLQMLIGMGSGKERTINEYRILFEKSGFRMSRLIRTVSPFCIIEGVKN